MRSSPLLLPVSWSMPRCRMTISGNSLIDFNLPRTSSTFNMSMTAYIPKRLDSETVASNVSAGAKPAATTASAVSSYAMSTSTFPTSRVFRSAIMNLSFGYLA
jgi:hypothetical protein